MKRNPSYRPAVPPFPWTAKGNRILDANGKTVCVFFDVPDPSWFAEHFSEIINENRQEIFPERTTRSNG